MALIRFDNVEFGSGNPLAAADVNALAQNARMLDGLSYRGRRANTNASIKYIYEYDQNPTIFFRGTFQYRTGVTSLVIITDSVHPGGGTHQIEVLLNGVSRLTGTLTAFRNTYGVTLNTLGFADLEFVDVLIRDNWTGADGQPVVVDIFTANMVVSGVGTYPGVPTFGALSKTNLDLLMAAQQWVYDCLNVTDIMAFVGPMLMVGNGYSTSTECLLFDGGIEYTNGASRLHIRYNYFIAFSASEVIKVRIDGTQVASATYTLGQSGEGLFDIDISSYPADQALRLTIVQTVGTLSSGRLVGGLYTIKDIFTRRASYPVPTLPALYSPRQSGTFSALQTALNQIATVTDAAALRVFNGVGAFQRQRVFRWMPGADDGQNAYYKRTLVARGRRAGDALWVRGKGLSIEYGPITSTYNPDKVEWESQYRESLIDGETVQTKLVYFDQFPGLDVGMEYIVIGDIQYVGEQVR